MENTIGKELATKSFLPRLSIKLLLVAVLFIGSLFLFAVIAHEIFFEKEYVFDSKVNTFFAQFKSREFIRIMTVFTFFGSTWFLIPAYCLLVIYFWARRKMSYSINIAIIGITSTLLMFGLKQVFHRKRPDLPLLRSLKTYSFPSGHSLSSFIFCSIFIYLIWKGNLQPVWKWILSVLLLAFSITIGISRIVLRMHYPTDVVAGFCLGFAWVILSFWMVRKIDFDARFSTVKTK